MGRFNRNMTIVRNTPDTVNIAGGAAYKISEQEELVGGIATSFAADAYYESWKGRETRLTPLIQKYPKLAAQAAVFARRELNMRSISHWVVAQVVRHDALRKEGGFVRDMINRVVIRPDDVTEILAIIGAKKIPNGLNVVWRIGWSNSPSINSPNMPSLAGIRSGISMMLCAWFMPNRRKL